MATRKKKSEIIISADIAEMVESTVVKGSHLTVITYPDGSTKLEWDDDALTRDVREAIASVENLTQGDSNGKTRKTRKSK